MQTSDPAPPGGPGDDVQRAIAAFGVTGMTYRSFGSFALLPTPDPEPAVAVDAPDDAPADDAPALDAAPLDAPALDASLWAVPLPQAELSIPAPAVFAPAPPEAAPLRPRPAPPPWQPAVPAASYRALAERIAARTGQPPLPPSRPAAARLRLHWSPSEPPDAGAADGDARFRRL